MSEPSRDISLETPAAARVRLKQIKPKPYAVERADMLVPLGRFLGATADIEVVWLSDAVDVGGGSDFVAAWASNRNSPDHCYSGWHWSRTCSSRR